VATAYGTFVAVNSPLWCQR